MQDIFNHTEPYNYNWSESVKTYYNTKPLLPWGRNPAPDRISHYLIKQNELVFDPILQKYRDQSYDAQLKMREKENIKRAIIKNADNQLKIEQTYNIINLQDRLKGFEKDPLYPKKADFVMRKNMGDKFNKGYNILSNLPLSQHHYDRPEKRPMDLKEAKPKERVKYPFLEERDYDIISARYKTFHDQKTKTDKDIQKLQTAEVFYKKNDYNIIKGVFYNEEKEKAFQKDREQKQKTWGLERFKNMPQCSKGKSDIYNLINLKTIDPESMKNMVSEEKNKKKRYEIKYQLENYYREQNLKQQEKKEEIKNGKASYQRIKEEDNRQFDILNLSEKPFKQNINKYKKGNMSEWERLLKGASQNNTFDTKQIYKEPYDNSEVGQKYDLYMNERGKSLKNLAKINEDKIFAGRIAHEKKERPRQSKSTYKEHVFNKEKFFKEPPKNVNSNEHKVIEENDEVLRKIEQFKNNKEKNMKEKKANRVIFQ